MILWVLAALVAIAIAAWIALRIAISINGPAVLSSVDWIAGGSRDGEQKAVISTGAHPSQKVVIWGPKHRDPADAPAPVLLFAHGGSWKNGDPINYGFIGRNFGEEGFIVVLIGYRLGADGKYPAMLEDTASAIAWAHENIASYGGDPARMVLAGHSAGAYNVVMAGLEEQWLGRRGLSTGDLAGVVGLAGPYDFYPFDSESTIAAFGDTPDPEATQPAAHVSGNAPPMLLFHGEKDTVVKVRNTRFLTGALEEAGAPVSAHYFPEHEHGDPIYALASPWRTRETHKAIFDLMVEFGRDPQSVVAETSAQTSVPVQGETR